jgi:hypothetical protein
MKLRIRDIENLFQPGAMAHACDPSYLGGRDEEDHGVNLGKKFMRLHLNQ